MTWLSFINFWIDRELGLEDSITRNYDLWRNNTDGMHESMSVILACCRLGLSKSPHDRYNNLKEVEQRIFDLTGVRPFAPKVCATLSAWYNYDRINKGELAKWFLKEAFRAPKNSQTI